MPHITTSMQRSVRPGIGEMLFDSLLGKRGITDEVNNVKDSFSSWDNCMNATYCKFVAPYRVSRAWLTFAGGL